MSQDALSVVVKIYPTKMLKVFVDDITACLEGRNKELPDIAEKVPRAMTMKVEEKGLRLSLNGGRVREEPSHCK